MIDYLTSRNGMLSSFRRPYTREGARSTRAGPDKPMAASEHNSLRGLSPEAGRLVAPRMLRGAPRKPEKESPVGDDLRCYLPFNRASFLSPALPKEQCVVTSVGSTSDDLDGVPPLCAFALSTLPPSDLTDIVSLKAGPVHLSARYYLTLEDIG